MIRKLLSMAMFLMTTLCVSAQMPELPSLPLDPAIKSGKLANGLTYYILHNEYPKDRANFYIAQKVGSTLEAPTQLGLAHFLEHMAFNGTNHYPGKNMLNYLQSKGIRFGADINAYTYYDETVYNIDNVSTTDKALMDSVLLCIYDWSNGILLEDAEIDAERGVIEEEWRSRNDANFRMLESVLPKIYSEYQYQQSVIGKMDIIRNFPYSEIREYYKKWYRPDQQGIVIVGDFDAAEMEKKVVELFSTIEMPENPAPRTYPEVSDNEKPIFAYFDDPETQYPRVDLSFKNEKFPIEYRNSQFYFINKLVERLISNMINNRLNDYTDKPECDYVYAGVRFGDFWVSKTKGAFDVTVIGKTEVKNAFNDAMEIITRACKTGFTDSEMQRAKDELLSYFENQYNERNNTNTGKIANMIIRHFIDNNPHPGFESEFELAKTALPMIQVEAINQAAKELLTPGNEVIVVSQPRKDGVKVVAEEEFVSNLKNILNKEYEAYVDEVITEPMISKLPKPGKIKSIKPGPFETTEIILSNGVKVVLKPTDFKADEIMMTAFANGGKQAYPASRAIDIMFDGDVFNSCKVGNFNTTTMRKYLAGKNVSTSYSFGSISNTFEGESSVKDLKYLFELIYASFTELNPDDEIFEATKQQIRTILVARQSNPQYSFINNMYKTVYGDNPMFMMPTVEDLDKLDYHNAIDFIKSTMKNAADFTFVFSGNIDLETIKPLLEQYVATLPADPKHPTKVEKLSSLNVVQGQVIKEWKEPMQAPATMVSDTYSGNNLSYSVENAKKVEMIGALLRNVFIDTLREEEGGTYSPYAGASFSPVTGEWFIEYQFSTNATQQKRMIERANEELEKLLKNGTTPDAFNKVKEAAIKQYENAIRSNSYWDNQLSLYLRGIDNITNGRAAIENVTVDELNAFMKSLYDGKNRIQVIMEGVEQAK